MRTDSTSKRANLTTCVNELMDKSRAPNEVNSQSIPGWQDLGFSRPHRTKDFMTAGVICGAEGSGKLPKATVTYRKGVKEAEGIARVLAHEPKSEEEGQSDSRME